MRVSEQFAEVMRELLGPDSIGQASIKTGVSKAYLADMMHGKVPSQTRLEAIMNGYSSRMTPDLKRRIYDAAGYVPPEAASPIDQIYTGVYRLRVEGAITPEKEARIRDYIRRVIEKADGKKQP